MDNVNEAWYKELSVPGTFYTSVTVRAFLNHFERDGSGLDCPAGVDIILDLAKLWDAYPRVSQFIIVMEEAQQKLVRASLPVSDNMVAEFATMMLLRGNSFPRDHPRWGGKPVGGGGQLWQA